MLCVAGEGKSETVGTSPKPSQNQKPEDSASTATYVQDNNQDQSR